MMDTSMFRELTPEEEAKFRQWALDNYHSDEEINPLWHPVVQDECERIAGKVK